MPLDLHDSYAKLAGQSNESGLLSDTFRLTSRGRWWQIAMSVTGQCQTTAVLLNTLNYKFKNAVTIDMLSLIMG